MYCSIRYIINVLLIIDRVLLRSGPEAACSRLSDRGSDPPEGSAGLCGLLHPQRPTLHPGGGAQSPAGQRRVFIKYNFGSFK